MSDSESLLESLDVMDASHPDPAGLMASSKAFVFPLWKEAGRSSGYFVNQLRYRLSKLHRVKRFKLGHAGTLDPFADGVLVLLGGKATRMQSHYMGASKCYECTVIFGAATPSLDPDTAISERDEAFALADDALRDGIVASLPSLIGEIDQLPPVYSAKQVDGQRAYKLARKGVQLELKPKRVVVHSIELLEVGNLQARLRVTCGSGVYIRAIARDLAAHLGTLGYLASLTRTSCGGFSRERAIPFASLLDALRIKQASLNPSPESAGADEPR